MTSRGLPSIGTKASPAPSIPKNITNGIFINGETGIIKDMTQKIPKKRR